MVPAILYKVENFMVTIIHNKSTMSWEMQTVPLRFNAVNAGEELQEGIL